MTPLDSEEAKERNFDRRELDPAYPSAKSLFTFRRAIRRTGTNVVIRSARDIRCFTLSAATTKEAQQLAQRLMAKLGRLRDDDRAYTDAVLGIARDVDDMMRRQSERRATGQCARCGCGPGKRCFNAKEGSCEPILRAAETPEEHVICSHCARKEQR